MGLGTVVIRGHSQPGVDLDRFDQRWRATGLVPVDLDRFQYGYDRDGNRLWRDNLVNSAFGELYSYDNLNQITSFDRGTLNGTKTGLTGSASRSQDWDFDALGNFDSVTTDSSTQTRSHNEQNEITSISGATTPTYDANGNMTGDETGRKFIYDAFNRLVTVKDSSNNVLESFAYDGVNRRVSMTASSTTTDLYYSAEWQVLEERVGGNTTMQYVWSPVYIDAMILRDRDTDANGSLDEKLWVQQDANWNVTALVNGSGSVVERYAYDPFGSATIYDASWGSRSSSSYAWLYLHQDGRFDATSGLYHFRNRDYSPTLGRWVRNDPIAYDARDVNLYSYVKDSPPNRVDPNGKCLVLLVIAGGIIIVAASGCSGKPHSEPSWIDQYRNCWGEGSSSRGNCCRFACASPLDRPNDSSGEHWWKPPSFEGIDMKKPIKCEVLMKAFVNELGWKVPGKDGKCPEGFGLAAMFTKTDEAGFHVLRLMDEGLWCGKDGTNRVTCLDNNGKPIHDPSLAQFNNFKFCGLMCAPRKPLPGDTGHYK